MISPCNDAMARTLIPHWPANHIFTVVCTLAPYLICNEKNNTTTGDRAMAQNMETVIEREVAEVQKAREDLLAKRAEIDEQLLALDRRLYAAQTYQAALEGKLPTVEPRTRKPRESSGPRAPRGSREQLKAQIIEVVKRHPDGLVSDQIGGSTNGSCTHRCLSGMCI
jgi:hypothetical protein